MWCRAQLVTRVGEVSFVCVRACVKLSTHGMHTENTKQRTTQCVFAKRLIFTPPVPDEANPASYPLASFDDTLLSFEGEGCPSLASLPPVPALAAPRDLSFTVSAPGARLAVTVGHGQSQTVAVGAAQQQPVAVLRYQYYG